MTARREASYKLLIFDADGTIFDYDRGEAYALEAAFGDAGLPFDGEEMIATYRRINADIWRAFEAGRIAQQDISRTRFTRFFEEVGLSAAVDAFATSYLEHLGEADFLVSGAAELIEFLAKDYSLAMVTNGLSRVQRSRFSRSPIGGRFHPVVISDEVGVQKPNPDIFDFVYETHTQVSPAESLMIGDSLTSDIAGGRAAGIDTCWYNPVGDSLGIADPQPTFEISRLSDLAEYLR